MRYPARALLAVLVVAAATAAAGEPITIGESFTLQSKVLGETRPFLVAPPPGYAGSSERYPVAVLLDGDVHLVHTRGTLDFLARNGFMPAMILVAVPSTERTRDLTPTHVAADEVGDNRREYPTSGGGERFEAFLRTELLPWVDQHYRTISWRMLLGHSFGGLFTVHTMLTHPDDFNAWVAVSPSFRWDDQLLLREAKAVFKKHKNFQETLFLSIGDEGERSGEMFDRFVSFVNQAGPGGFRLATMKLDDEDHNSVVLRSHYHALRSIFAGWRVALDPATGRYPGGLAALKKHYAELGSRLGMPVAPPELVVNLLGYRAMAAGDLDAALELFSLNAANHPTSANTHDSLGEGLEAAGRLDEAKVHFKHAVALGRDQDDPNTAIYKQHMERAEKALEAAKERTRDE